MVLSKCINWLIMELGLNQVSLPFKDPVTGKQVPVENVVREVLTTSTIPEYSQFVPWQRECICNLRDMKCLDEKLGIYLLHPYLTMTPVMYVVDVSLPYNVGRATFSDIDLGLYFGMSKSVQGIAAGQAQLMLADQIRAEPSFEYLGNNKIKLYGWPKTELKFEVAAEHEPNGESIPDGCYDSFCELADLDVKVFLWGQLKNYDNISSAYGTIALKLDEYSNASNERKELLNEWRDKYHVDLPYSMTWM